MEVLLRELREGPDGIAEYHDTEVAATELTIGSAANQHIQLLGRAIAPEQAVIRQSGTKIELSSRSGKVRVNGNEVTSASLVAGDLIEIGGHTLTLASPPGGFDVAIELRLNTSIDASEFEGAFRTDMQQTWLRKRSTAWIAVTLVLLAGLVVPLIAVMMHRADRPMPALVPSDALWSSGPLSAAHHQAAGGRCDTCHQKFFERVQDQACQSCHQSTHSHISPEHLALTKLGATQRCATCHREHNEPAKYLVNSGDGLCIDCHRSPDPAFGSLKLQPVSGFGSKRHPAFNAHLLKPQGDAPTVIQWVEEIATLENAKEQSNLKFSHAQHLDPDRVQRASDSQQLNCADCHRLEPDGEHFAPLTMETSCSSCHELTFDLSAPERQLPHGKPREVAQTLVDYFTRKFSDPEAGRPARERRRLPGHEEEEQTCTGPAFDCAMRAARTEVETQFSRRGCVGCHMIVDTGSSTLAERFEVFPIRLARDYFPGGRFDHRSHQIQGKLTGDAACLSCHKAKDSKDSADLLLPAMNKCEDCHGDRPAVERITVQCVDCHGYHGGETAPDKRIEARVKSNEIR